MRKRSSLIITSAVILAGAITASAAWMMWMPGQTYRGDFPRMSASETVLRDRLRKHVHHLAGEIGERNVWQFVELEAARQFIATEFEAMGYPVEFQEFRSGARTVSNVIAGREGGSRAEKGRRHHRIGDDLDDRAGERSVHLGAMPQDGLHQEVEILETRAVIRDAHA